MSNVETASFVGDSDRKAWKFFEEFYASCGESKLWEDFAIDGPLYSCAYDSVSRKYRLFRGDERLYAFSRKQVYSLVVDKNYEADDVCKRLGGNVDFNFGAGGGSEGKSYGGGKYASRLKRIAGEKDPALLERIDRMSERSLRNPNISLMYVTGNLQGVQARGLPAGSGFEWLDRPDTLVYHLSLFYADRAKWRCIYRSMVRCGEANRSALESYLEGFGCIAQYCKCVYGIGEDLVKVMVESGSQPIDGAERVREYLDLAERFWEERAELLCDRATVQAA